MASVNVVHDVDAEELVNYFGDQLAPCPVKRQSFHDALRNPPSDTKTVTFVLVTPGLATSIQAAKDARLQNLFPAAERAAVVYFCPGGSKESVRRVLSRAVSDFSRLKELTVMEEDFETVLSSMRTLVSEASSRKVSRPGLSKFFIHPAQLYTATDPILITFLNESYVKDVSDVTVRLCANGSEFKADRRGTNTAWCFTPNGLTVGGNEMEVFGDGKWLGKCMVKLNCKMDKLAAILNDVIDPLHLLCQSLNIQGQDCKEDLDRDLTDILGQPNESLKRLFDESLSCFQDDTALSSKKEFPTIVHFGAKFGLGNFMRGLSNFPGYQRAIRIRNSDGLLPTDLARQAGHTELATNLEDGFVEELPSPRLPVSSPRTTPYVPYALHPTKLSSDSIPSPVADSGRLSQSSGHSSTSGGSSLSDSRSDGRTMTQVLDPSSFPYITPTTAPEPWTSSRSSRGHTYEELTFITEGHDSSNLTLQSPPKSKREQTAQSKVSSTKL